MFNVETVNELVFQINIKYSTRKLHRTNHQKVGALTHLRAYSYVVSFTLCNHLVENWYRQLPRHRCRTSIKFRISMCASCSQFWNHSGYPGQRGPATNRDTAKKSTNQIINAGKRTRILLQKRYHCILQKTSSLQKSNCRKLLLV